MRTGNNTATNNFIIRIWSKAHYGINDEKYRTGYHGSVTEVKTKEEHKFHSVAELLTIIEKLNKKLEKARRGR